MLVLAIACSFLVAQSFAVMDASGQHLAGDRAVVVERDGDFLTHWRTSKQFTLLVAEAMPEEHYAFKPVPEEMSFGTLMIHIGASSLVRLSTVAGAPVSVELPAAEKASKTTIVAFLRESLDTCEKLIPRIDEPKLTASYKVDWEGMPTATGREILWAMFTHMAHHRGQAEVYMRIKGLTPPRYRF